MLPGFRFLLTAIVLSTSILIFGLGAAALLRAAHEQFASNPYWRRAPEATSTQQAEATRLVLAMLRAEPPADQNQKASGNVAAANAAPVPLAAELAPMIIPAELPTAKSSRTEQAFLSQPPSEHEGVAAAQREEKSPDVAEPELTKIPSQSSPCQAQNEALAADATAMAAPPSASQASIASLEQSANVPAQLSGNEIVPASTEADPAQSSEANTLTSADTETGSTKIASLNSPSLIVDSKARAKGPGVKPDQSAIKKRLQARRVEERRRIAARARQVRLAPPQPLDPFAQFAQPPAAGGL
jgi:hypothetical protein